MIGRTNILFGSGSGSGGSGGVTTVDLPTCPASLTANSGNGKVTLTLAYSDTDFVSGVEVRYKTGSYPTSPTDGSGKIVNGAATSIEISGLTNGTAYYFRVYLYREIDGVKYYQTDETNAKVSTIPSSVHIEGMTPTEVGENYILLAESGTFTLHTPENITVYLVGGGCNGQNASPSVGGGDGGYGGYVYSMKLNAINNAQCSCSIGAASTDITNTSLTIDTTQYNASSGTYLRGGGGAGAGSGFASESGITGILTPYNFVGSSGGGGAFKSTSLSHRASSGGSGAGHGGSAGYSGGTATNYGCGGGGGGCNTTSSTTKYGHGGAGKKGCIIITWT